jgi:phosphomannomutase
VDALVSTDGDSDRPLVLGVDADAKVQFFGGDLVGMVVAEYLGADAVVVPISCNDAIDRGSLAGILEPKTRIGSPYVIAGMDAALRRGRQRVCGWEANGGFLTGSTIVRQGKLLAPLPTRDAVLPILCTLFSAHEKRLSLSALFATLPRRFSRSALLKQFPRRTALGIVKRFSPADSMVKEARFDADELAILDVTNAEIAPSELNRRNLLGIRESLSEFFSAENGFAEIRSLNYTDGVRIGPSGNADELRIYAVADTEARANAIAALGIAEPAGILRSMEKSIGD